MQNIITLKLRSSATPDRDLASAALVDALLNVIGQLAASAATSGSLALVDRLNAFRAHLTRGELSPTSLERSGAEVVSECQQFFAESHAATTTRQRELCLLVDFLHRSLKNVLQDLTGLHGDVLAFSERLNDIARLQDIRQIRLEIRQEISSLTEAATRQLKEHQARHTALSQQMTALQSELAMAKDQARKDPLTGIGNRAAFDDKLDCLLGTPGSSFSLAFLDIDNFKSLNDTYGHPAGDLALQRVAAACVASVRSGDLVARLGGDEFGILIEGTPLRNTEVRMRDLVATIAGIDMTTEQGETFRVSVSCGAAEYSAGDRAEVLRRRCDDALYQAKRSGKNRVVSKAAPFLRELLGR